MATINPIEEINLVKVASDHPAFADLVAHLDEELKVFDGDMHEYYHQYNGVADLKHIILVYVNEVAVGCGAFKSFDQTTVEIKRMYVEPSFRRKGLAVKIIRELEQWASNLGNTRCILETGVTQEAAVKLYGGLGYQKIDNFGPYKDLSSSICFEKKLD